MRRLSSIVLNVRVLAACFVCALLAIALASCGGASSSASGASAGPAQGHSVLGGTTTNATAGGDGTTGGQPAGSATPAGPQYLVKSLAVNMTVKDPRQTAAALQTWVTATDSRATSAGLNYQQIGPDQYNVTLTFAVEASLYPQVESYLAGYPEKQGGQLVSLQESVQDMTNDYIDNQARLSNLRNEQQRLQTILDRAQSMSDVLTVEQQVTQVEGQIEQIEAHLNALTGQTTFYMVTINLEPLGSSAPGQVAPPGPFNPGGTLHDALAAALVVAEWLATVLIWVAVFSLFAVPVALVALLVRRIRRVVLRRRQVAATVG